MDYPEEDPKNLMFEEPSLEGYYTAQDYLKWHFEGYVELIKGRIFKMSPAPRDPHQALLATLASQFYTFLKGQPCTMRFSPYDVYLVKDGQHFKDTPNVVQPDLVIICDRQKICDLGCVGSPDFIVEILSPSTRKKDLTQKYDLYQEYAVPEYWTVDIPQKSLSAHRMKNGKYDPPQHFGPGDTIGPLAFPDLSINVAELFAEAGL